MKRGVTHIEVVFSFLIFISVVTFSFFYFNPLSVKSLNEENLKAIQGSVENQITTNLKVYTLYLNNTCEQIEYVLDPSRACSNNEPKDQKSGYVAANIGLTPQEKTTGIQGFNYSGSPISARFGENSENAEVYFSWKKEDGNIIYLTTGKEMVESNVGFVSHFEEYYDVLNVQEKKIISFDESEKLVTKYSGNFEDYQKLKREIGIPSHINFGFEVNVDGEELKAQRNILEGTEVFTKKYRREILKKNGESKFGDFLIKIW